MDEPITPTVQMLAMTMNFNDLVSDVERRLEVVKAGDFEDPQQINDALELAVGTLQSAKRIMATLTEFCVSTNDTLAQLIHDVNEEIDEDVPDLP